MGGVVGVGLDLVKVSRLSAAIERRGTRFVNRLLSEAERDELARRRLFGPRLAEYLAGRFAAKEAVAKALGAGISVLGWRNIEVLAPGQRAAPECRLNAGAAEFALGRGVSRVLVSITHESGAAAACAVALGE